jgi:excinuclease UvrABC nuclease subunit
MDIFAYLEDDGAKIGQRLSETAKNYSEWSRDRIFEEAKKAFASVKEHFAREVILESNIKNGQPIQALLTEASKQKKEITAEIESIVEIHVDEPGFEQALEDIAAKYAQYAQYCKDKYYPAIKKILSADDLKHINEQMEQKILS